MPTFLTGQAPNLYDGRVLNYVTTYESQDPEHWRSFMRVKSINTRHYDSLRFAGLGTVRLKNEGAPIFYDVGREGTRRRTVVQTYALGTRASMEAIADALYDQLDRMPQDLARSHKEHKENQAVLLLDDSFDGNTHTGLDGLSLVNTAHTLLNPPTSGDTESNELSPGVALSTEGLEAAMTILRLTRSEEGRQMGFQLSASQLNIHPANEHVATTILDSAARPDANHSGVTNTMATSRTGMRPNVLPHLSDEESWWITISPSDPRYGLIWLERMPAMMDNGTDFETKDRKWDAMRRDAVTIDDWRGVVGSQV